jgi:hypothetical protein
MELKIIDGVVYTEKTLTANYIEDYCFNMHSLHKLETCDYNCGKCSFLKAVIELITDTKHYITYEDLIYLEIERSEEYTKNLTNRADRVKRKLIANCTHKNKCDGLCNICVDIDYIMEKYYEYERNIKNKK